MVIKKIFLRKDGQLSKRKVFSFSFTLILLVLYYFSIKDPLFNTPTATVLEDKKGNLLGARIADDGQWRFPAMDSIPYKFKMSIIHFEDQYFYKHIGVNPFSLARAFYQNIRSNKIVSGASTISMQVIRLSRRGKSRTIFEKLVEIILATRLELSYTKEEILALHASHAPFGGNVVGLEAASWRYYGRAPSQLSWAESAVLSVLPNQPSLIYPGKNQKALKRKRDRLLRKLLSKNIIDSLTYTLAIDEPLPGKPVKLPNLTPHLTDRAIKDKLKGRKITTTVDIELQRQVVNILSNHSKLLKSNEIHNGAALILEVKSGNTLAYAGNIITDVLRNEGQQVDIITSPRSTGSILKPFLYALMLEEGQILKETLLPDVPTYIKGFAPKNFSKSYDGAVKANVALSRSLNVPAVHMLRDFGIEKFHFFLNAYGMTTLNNAPGHYGLSLILGGSEATLWDLCGMYATMARTLNNFFIYPEPDRYSTKDLFPPRYLPIKKKVIEVKGNIDHATLSAPSIWQTFQAMLEVYRPLSDASWKLYGSSQKIAWKTGTSFGFRDGWAIGITPEYVVGVWIGNADGEGRPGLTGITAAGPVLFDIFKHLPNEKWFTSPASEMIKVPVCRESGHRINKYCNNIDTTMILKSGLKTKACPYHQLIHLDKQEKFRVNSQCEDIDQIVHKSWFILPPIQEYYFKAKSPNYSPIPPERNDCIGLSETMLPMQFIYPRRRAKILIPRELDGVIGKAVFKVAHRHPNTKIFWHLDDEYIGQTSKIHQMGLSPKEGLHVLTLVDENGVVLKENFEIIAR